MATRDLQDIQLWDDEQIALPDSALPPFPDSQSIREAFKGISVLGPGPQKIHFIHWIDFALEHPDEIWDPSDSTSWQRYFYVSFLELNERAPAFVVEVIQIDDFLEVNDFTLVINNEHLEWLRSGISVYSLRKEWDRERLARALNDKALRAYDENRLAEALRLIDTAIQLTGRSFAYLFNNKGLISWKMGLTDQAKRDFHQAIDLDSSNGDPYFNLGLIYFDESNHESALKYLGQAVDISPSDSQFLTELGHLYLELDREDEAFDLFERATTTNPNDPQADFHLGYYHLYKKNQPRRAVEYYGRGLRKDPDDQFALADYAVAQWTAGNKRKALGIRRLLQDQPQLLPYTISRLVYLNLEMGDYENALKYYRYALNLSDPFEPEWLHYYAAVACVKIDRIQEALDLLKLAIGAGGDAVLQRALAEKDLRTITGTAAFKSLKKSPSKSKNG